ncbi:hypothetical protein T08_5908 [Trichinella sp. T8]|nr:hypothetical protein T08_5908 [Trichinella sp. T8]
MNIESAVCFKYAPVISAEVERRTPQEKAIVQLFHGNFKMPVTVMSLLTGLGPLLDKIQEIEGIFPAAREKQTGEYELWWYGPKEGLKSKGELQRMDAISLTDEEAQRLGHMSRTLTSAVFLNQ